MKRRIRDLDKRELETMSQFQDWLAARSEPLSDELWARMKNFFDDIGYANLRVEEEVE